MVRRLIGLFLCMMLLPAYGNSVIVKNIRFGNHDSMTRIVFELSDPYIYQAFTLNNPNRLVVDFKQATILTDLKKLPIHQYRLNEVRASKTASGLRLVFDMQDPMKAKIMRLDSMREHRYRLVIDLVNDIEKPKINTKVVTPLTITPISKPKQHLNFRPASLFPSFHGKSNQQIRDVIVVIDPGHGGKDPGASGARGTKEKDVVLGISKALQREINRQRGMKAYLTRDGDYYIGLRERLNIARKHHADIFVAVHADAFMKRNSSGASVFALSQRGASSEAAQWLAQRENHSELGDANLMDKGYILRSVLIDLSQTATISASLHMGKAVLDQIGRIARLHNRRVEQAGFVVLKSPDIPSILIETGFISNPTEEMHLQSYRFQHQLAKAVTQGLVAYFKRFPPRNTLLAANQGGKTQW